MNVSEIAARIKRQFGDESGVQVTDEDILRWVNDAQKEITRIQSLLETQATTTVISGQNEYSLPLDILMLRSIRLGGQKIRTLSLQEAEEYIPGFDDETTWATGTPEVAWIWANNISLYPIPTSAGTLKVYYTRVPVEVTAMIDSPELPVKYHPRIVEYCLAQAYEMDENWDGAGNKSSQFVTSISEMREEEKWTDHTYYPTITVLPEDI